MIMIDRFQISFHTYIIAELTMTSHSLKPLAKCLIFKDLTTGWWLQDVLPLFSPVISHHQSLHCHKYLVWNLLTLKHKAKVLRLLIFQATRWYLSNYTPYPDPLLSCATVPSSDKFVNLDELSAGGKDWILVRIPWVFDFPPHALLFSKRRLFGCI
jgi:hypothetical protein